MTLSSYIALARDIAILVVLAVILYLVYRGGEDHVSSSDLKGLQNQVTAQAKIVSGWKDQNNAANTQLTSDMAAIRAISSAPAAHSWVLNTAPCPANRVLPGAPASAPSSAPASGGLLGVAGSVSEGLRRDAVTAAFKAQWETPLAQCRAALASWPK